MKGLKITITIILWLVLCTAAYSQEEPATAKAESGSAPEKATAAKEDDRLPIYKEAGSFFWRRIYGFRAPIST